VLTIEDVVKVNRDILVEEYNNAANDLNTIEDVILRKSKKCVPFGSDVKNLK
jgi:hypothetical protein